MIDTPMPIAMAPIGATLPHAGVMATRPATAAVAPPRAVGLPRWIHSITAHATTAVDAAVLVFKKASVASRLGGGGGGGRASSRRPRRLRGKSAATIAEKPLDMCPTRPPAKSMAPAL